MPEISTSCVLEDVSTVTTVTTSTADDTTTTTTNTTTCTKTTSSSSDDDGGCHFCGNLNLEKLTQETRCTALKSSNLAASTSNAILIFTEILMQEIIKNECKKKNPDIEIIFRAALAIAALAENLHLYNPQPFNP